MASTRDFVSLGEFAKDADEVQEPGVPVRVQGESYRNTSFTQFQQNIGKQFGVVPVSENVNQQIFNQTQFTDWIGKQGIPGWGNEVTYDKPAVVIASDGKLYFNKRDGNLNIDPVGANNANEEWWGEFIDGSGLANIFANETEGQEGARLVGVTNTNNETTVSRVGETLQNGLVRNEKLLADNMKNIRVVAAGNIVAINDGSTFFKDKESVNIDSVNITVYSKTAIITNGTTNRIGYVTVNFNNPVPTPYLYMLDIEQRQFDITSGSRILLHQTSFAIADPTSDSIKIGALMLTNMRGSNIPAGFWPPVWETEDPDSRIRWNINFTCFLID